MTTRRTVTLAVVALMLLVLVAASLRMLGRVADLWPGRQVGTIITEVTRLNNPRQRPPWAGVRISPEERADLQRSLRGESTALPYDEAVLLAPDTEGFAWAVAYDTCQVLEAGSEVTVDGDRLVFDPGRTVDRDCYAPNYSVTVFWIEWDEVPATFTVDQVLIKDRQRA